MENSIYIYSRVQMIEPQRSHMCSVAQKFCFWL
jgi:hypothetical protein